MIEAIETPPYRVVTERLVLRCWSPEDAEELRVVASANREHLLPWIPWGHQEPQTLDEKVDLLRRFRGEFDLGRNFVYGMFDRESNRLVGGTGLHPTRSPGGLEIGYWVDHEHQSRGYASEAATALVRTAFECTEIARLEIRCDPRNARSMAIPERLGFSRDGLLRASFRWHDETYRDTVVWTLLPDEYPASPAATCEIQGFDAIGRCVLGSEVGQ